MNRIEYYSQTYVLLELVKSLYKRELALIDTTDGERKYPVRCIKAWNINFLKENFKTFTFFKRKYNMYYSLATLKNMPMFSFNPNVRRLEQSDFNLKFDSLIDSFDFVFDLDNDNFQDCFDDAKQLKAILDKFGLPYSLRFSGRKGFHFAIQGKHFKELNQDIDSLIKSFQVIALILKNKYNIKSIDSGIYDSRRIFKLPYSLVFVEGKEYVVLPLTDKQFNSFKKEDTELNNVVSSITIKNRGLLERKGSKENIKKFLDYFKMS
jgi:hypothetical protein